MNNSPGDKEFRRIQLIFEIDETRSAASFGDSGCSVRFHKRYAPLWPTTIQDRRGTLGYEGRSSPWLTFVSAVSNVNWKKIR
jgi:hypothetical protein